MERSSSFQTSCGKAPAMECSIIIPTYNRKKFENLISDNINRQDYYNIKEVIILDDGDDDILNLTIKYPIIYLKNMSRTTIGHKRNLGCSIASSPYIAFMDTDDYYDVNYISHSIFKLSTTDYEVAGCADMNMYDGVKYYKQRCMFIHMLNEATLIFKKSYWLNNKFRESNTGEGLHFLEKNCDKIIEVKCLMVCFVHGKNTIDKSPWVKEQYESKPLNYDLEPYLNIFV